MLTPPEPPRALPPGPVNKPYVKRVKTSFDAWSFSRLATYTQCPRKAQLRHLQGIEEPQNPAMARGEAMHNAIAELLRTGKVLPILTEIPPESLDYIERLRAHAREMSQNIFVEGSVTVTRAWTMTHAKDWTGAWLRGKLDAAYWLDDGTLRIVDWKTGQYKPKQNAEYGEQLELYALLGLLAVPHMRAKSNVWASWPKAFRAVAPSLYYLDHSIEWSGDGEQRVFYPSDLEALNRKSGRNGVKPMLVDDIFAPRPSALCGWCHYGQAGIGRCEY